MPFHPHRGATRVAPSSRAPFAQGSLRSRSWLSIAAALIASGAMAGPASADVREGNNVTVFPNRDMVVLEGGYSGQVNVEVRRNGVLIGQTSGPAQNLGDVTGLEVNHGPLGTAKAGDCWTTNTPDIRGGDVIHVTDGQLGADEMTVGPVDLDEAGPQLVDAGLPTEAVVLNASAAGATRDQLASEVRSGNQFRATGQLTPGADGAWTIRFPAPYVANRNQINADEAERRQLILESSHMLTHTGAANAITIAELGEKGGPAPGCESAPLSADAVTSADDAYVNIASGDLVLSGTARDEVTSVQGAVTDSAGTAIEFTGALSEGTGPKTWQATIARADLEKLVDGPLTASMSASSPIGVTPGAPEVTPGATEAIPGAPLKLVKDTIAPDAPTGTPRPGTYASAQSVTLAHADADTGTRIRYTNNGTDPSASSPQASGPFMVTATQTIKAIALDSAGNSSAVASLDYRIEAPAPQVPVVAPAATPPAPVSTPVARPVARTASATVSRLRATGSRSARVIARKGLTVGFTAPAEAGKVQIEVTRGTKVIARQTVTTTGAKQYSVHLSGKVLRNLKAGTYRVEAAVIGSDAAAASTSLRIVR